VESGRTFDPVQATKIGPANYGGPLGSNKYILRFSFTFIIYPAHYNSWFPSEDNDNTAYSPDFENQTTLLNGSINQSQHHSDIISTSSGHSQTPTVDFQVPLHSDSLLHSYSHSILNFSSLNSLSVSDSQSLNSSVPSIISIEALLKLNTPESLY
jgi:hypothetical protein